VRRGSASLLKSSFSRYWLCLAIIKLSLRAYMKSSASLVLLLTLDVAGLRLQIASGGFVEKRCLDRGIVELGNVRAGV
jgi:hypothetical protein